MAMVLEELVVNFLFKGDRKGLKKLEQDIDRGVASVKRELKPVTRALTAFEGKAKDALRKAGLAVEDFSDETAEMSREARRDFDRVGREADELGRDMADLSQKTERELGQAERAMGDFADKAQRTSGTVGTALGAIASAFAIKDASDFRIELARVDNQLQNLSFKEVETSVLAVSDAIGLNRTVVAQLASQIDNTLAPTAEAFEAVLLRSAKLQKAVGLEDITHVQRLINIGFEVLPESQQDLFADQLTTFLQKAPLAREELDGLATGIQQAFAAGIQPIDYLAALSLERFSSQEMAGAVVEDLGRELNEFVAEGGSFDLNDLLTGKMEFPDTFGEQTKAYMGIVRRASDVQAKFLKGTQDYNNALGTTDRALHNITQASGGLAGILVWLDNLIARVSGTVLEIGGAFVGLLPAMGGAALTLQSLGFDLSGIGERVRGFFGTLRTGAATIWARVIPALTAFKITSWAAFAPMLVLGGKVVLIAAAIAAAGALIYKYWEPLKAFFQGFMIGMGEALASLGDAFAEALKPLAPVWAVLGSMFSQLGDGIRTALNWLKEFLTPVEESAEGFAAAANAGIRLGQVLGFVLLLPLRMLSVLLRVVTTFLSLLGQLFAWVGRTAWDLGAVLTGFLAPAFAAVRDGVMAVGRWMAEHSPAEAFMMAWEGIVDFVSSLFGDVYDVVVAGVARIASWLAANPVVTGLQWLGEKLGLAPQPRVTPPSAEAVPALDTGGIVSQPTLAALAMNSRPEAILPLDQLGGFLRDLSEMTAQAMAPPLIGPIMPPAFASAGAGPVTKNYSFHWDALNVSVEHGDPDEIAATVGRALEQQLHNVVEDFDDDVER